MSKRIEVEIIELFERLADSATDVSEILNQMETLENANIAHDPVYIKLRILERYERLTVEQRSWLLAVLQQRYSICASTSDMRF